MVRGIFEKISQQYGKDYLQKYLKEEMVRGSISSQFSPRKREFLAHATRAKIRGESPSYNPYVYEGGFSHLSWDEPFPYRISGTDFLAERDDLYYVNNPAMQQMWDDIRRTVIIGLDVPHEVLKKRLGLDITSSSVNNYMEILNHLMLGGAAIQENMVEIHPGLVYDCSARLFTGSDELADEIDPQYLIDINKLFSQEHAEQIKDAIGSNIWLAAHIPTIIVRSCDGAATHRWVATQASNAFITAYRTGASEAAIAEIAYALKHVTVLHMSDILGDRFWGMIGQNYLGGLSFGFMSDIVQTSRVTPWDPVLTSLNVVAAGSVLYDQILMTRNSQQGQLIIALYIDDVLDDFIYYGIDYGIAKFGGFAKAPAILETAKDIASEIACYALEQYDEFTTLSEKHYEDCQRTDIISTAGGIASSCISGDSHIGLAGFHLGALIVKEAWGRTGFEGYDFQHCNGPANTFSYQSDEGSPLELRSPNYPNYKGIYSHTGGIAGIVSGAHAARGDAFALNPLIKVAFSNPSLVFPWHNIRVGLGLGANRSFRAFGERGIVSFLS